MNSKVLFSDHSKGPIMGFLEKEAFSNSIENIRKLLDTLINYEEEGDKLSPEILMVDDLELIQKVLGESKTIIIGKEKYSTCFELAKGLKVCAPLARDGWIIFYELTDATIKYGLITLNFLSPSVYEQLFGALKEIADSAEPTYKAIYIRSVAPGVVELNGLSSNLTLSSLHSENALENKHDVINEFVRHSFQDAGENDIAKNIILRILWRAISKNHGFIIGVIKDEDSAIVDFKANCKDGMYINTPIDLLEEVSVMNSDPNAKIIAASLINLVTDMVCSDGITLITTKLRVIGFRVFLKQIAEEVHGGARMRAFKKLADSENIHAAVFLSQDGRMESWK